MTKTKKVAVPQVAQAIPNLPAFHVHTAYTILKDRNIPAKEWSTVYGDVKDHIVYSAYKHVKDYEVGHEVLVLKDIDDLFHIWLLQSSIQYIAGSDPVFRITEVSNNHSTAEQALRDACEALLNASVILHLTEDEAVQLCDDAIFKLQYEGDAFLINVNTGDSGYTFTQYREHDFRLIEQQKFFDLDEAKQCVRGQIANDLEEKLNKV